MRMFRGRFPPNMVSAHRHFQAVSVLSRKMKNQWGCISAAAASSMYLSLYVCAHVALILLDSVYFPQTNHPFTLCSSQEQHLVGVIGSCEIWRWKPVLLSLYPQTARMGDDPEKSTETAEGRERESYPENMARDHGCTDRLPLNVISINNLEPAFFSFSLSFCFCLFKN